MKNMPKKMIKRLQRTGRLSAEQAARDRAVRQQIEKEFPPKQKPQRCGSRTRG